MAASIIESHMEQGWYLIRMTFTAQDDTLTIKFPKVMRQLAAECNIRAGGTLSAFTVTGLIGLNATIDPVEAGFSCAESDLYELKSDESPFTILKVTTTSWTGASTLEVTVGGTY